MHELPAAEYEMDVPRVSASTASLRRRRAVGTGRWHVICSIVQRRWRKTRRSRGHVDIQELPMNLDTIKGQWKQLKGEAKIRWGKLTDDELDQIEGNADKLAGLLQQKYGYARDEARREVDDLFRSYSD
jgi:uncharacterized protein YjbJ (UPF0337 family)